jgi:hypothetical protein
MTATSISMPPYSISYRKHGVIGWTDGVNAGVKVGCRTSKIGLTQSGDGRTAGVILMAPFSPNSSSYKKPGVTPGVSGCH